MAGYDGYSMSVRARAAYRAGLKPASKIKTGLPASLVERFCQPDEWHHTSKRYNRTDFFDPEYVLATFGLIESDEWEADERAIAALQLHKRVRRLPKHLRHVSEWRAVDLILAGEVADGVAVLAAREDFETLMDLLDTGKIESTDVEQFTAEIASARCQPISCRRAYDRARWNSDFIAAARSVILYNRIGSWAIKLHEADMVSDDWLKEALILTDNWVAAVDATVKFGWNPNWILQKIENSSDEGAAIAALRTPGANPVWVTREVERIARRFDDWRGKRLLERLASFLDDWGIENRNFLAAQNV